MAAERKLTVVLAGDASGLSKALGKAEGDTGRFGSKLGGLSGTAKVAFAGAVTAAVGFASSSVSAYAESEQAQTRLTDAFSKFPQLAGGNIDALRNLNTELSKKTKFDDDATASGQAVLAQFGLTADQLADVTPLLQDYAAKTGKDLPTAAKDFGKAILTGEGRALKQVGIDFEDSGTAAGNFQGLMDGLRTQVGGFAQKEGATAAGKAQILKNQFGELQETVGAKLVPVLTRLAEIGLSVINFISNLSPGLQIAIGVAAGLGVALFTIVKAVQAWTAVQAALNAVLALNPIVLIVAGVVAFIAILVVAYQKVGWFRNLVDGAFRLIKTVIMTAFNWVKNNWPLLLAILTGPIGLAVLAITKNWDTIKAGVTKVKDWIVARFNDVVGFVSGLPGKISSAASGMWDGIKNAFRGAINWIIGAWNGLEFKIPGFDPPGPGPKFGGFTLGVPNIPELAQGAIVRATPGGTLARIGEGRFDEAVVPLDGRALGGSVVVDLRGSFVASGIEFERIVRKAIADTVGRNGKIPGTNIVRATP